MPEGPEAKTIADKLHRSLSGKFIVNLSITPKSKYFNNQFKGQEKLIFPLEIVEVSSRGKKVVFDLRSLDQRRFRLISSLGMTGHWHYKESEHTALIFDISYRKKVNFKFTDEESSYYFNSFQPLIKLCFDDYRRFGNLYLCSNDQEYENVFKDTGPDLLSETITFDEYRKKIRNPRLSNKEIVWFLMQQQYFSGIGNYLKSEILYASKIYPGRLIGTLNDLEIRDLYICSLAIIRESYQSQGLTISDYWDPDGNKGIFETKVYGKDIDPNGYKVFRTVFSDNNRTTHWVPQIQGGFQIPE